MTVKLIWMTEGPDTMIGYMARVSNPAAKLTDPTEKLIAYLLRNAHWSPFEMANMCVEVNTTRDIARQILRHRSFSFQEFSQRYSEVTEMADNREARLQDTKNRQNSIPTEDEELSRWWDRAQNEVKSCVKTVYEDALKRGIAKEVARAVLPEGLTPTKMYMNGTFRSWLTFFSVRIGNGTQLECQQVAKEAYEIFAQNAPTIAEAYQLYVRNEA